MREAEAAERQTEMGCPGAAPRAVHEAYLLYAPAGAPPSPIVHAVPHAGRDYPPGLLAGANVSAATLMRLEDRHADLLAHGLVREDGCVLVARRPRAMIDLNRGEREYDPRAIADLPRRAQPLSTSKVRGGLGLIPERLAYAGALWQRPLPYAELTARIEGIHRPYHAALQAALQAARARHGVALLLDIHSMPPLARPAAGGAAPRLVLGDRFGRSAAGRLTALCADVARAHGVEPTVNAPYAGDHILDRHGDPERGVHAIQLEIDRSLYLDESLSGPGPGLAAAQRLVAHLSRALREELGAAAWPLAAE